MIDRFMVVALRNLTDSVATQPIHIDKLWFWAIAYPSLFLGSEVIWRLSGFSGMLWINGLRATIYQRLYEYLSHHSKEYFNNRFAGALTNKISNAVEGSGELISRILWNFFPLVMSIIWFTIFTGISDWRLGLIVIVWALLFIGINILFVTKLKPYSYRSANALSTLKGRLVDSLANISLVQEYAHLFEERKYVNRFIKRQYDTGVAHWRFGEWMLAANSVLIALFMLVMISSSVYLFQHHVVSIGVIVMAIAIVSDLSGQFFFIGQEMTNATKYYGEIKEGLTEILQQHTISDEPDAKVLKVSQGAIEIKNMMFEYGETQVFSELSLKIPGGQKVGLVGRSGAGKTTFASLLLRHFDIQEGEIAIDGQNIRHVTLESLRKAIAFVPQDTSLFHRTIKENIQYGSPQTSDEDISKAAKLSHADEFIQKLPQGYDTLVGERGVKLSGGQRQRIAIARAFLKNSPIVVLDEATSSLDSHSEHAIQESIEKLMKERTVIAIAHRLSTLKEMDRIVVLENGQIVEDGTPEALLKKENGIFKQLWDHQVNGFLIDE